MIAVSDFRPPAALIQIAEALEARGFEAWAVGGAVRDELLGHHRADWDVATDARPDDVRRVFGRTIPIGIEHGTVGVIASDGELYEITTFRRDVATDGRHAVIEFADRIDEDLGRRDFTINALAWRPATDELVDPFHGRTDMERRVLRAVGDPATRFAEDYLRVLRGLRFAGRFALDIDPDTRTALREAVDRTSRLSAERVRDELLKVLEDPRPSDALRLYAEFGVLEVWYPEIADLATDPRFELYLAAVDAIPAARRALRIAGLLLPSRRADGEPVAAEAVLRRLRFSNSEIRRTLHLVRHAEPLVGPVDSDAQIRLWLAEVGAEHARDLFRLRFASARARGAEEEARFLIAAWRRAHDQLGAAPPLRVSDLAIGGRELLELGVSRGPAVGIVLDELHARVLEDPELNERARLLELAAELIEQGRLGRRDGSGTVPGIG